MKAAGICVLIALAAASPAFGQPGPSFDCTKASSRVEREICRSAELGKADRTMAAAYATLLDRLSGPAREHAIKDQVRWVGNRERACSAGFLETPQCLALRFEGRTARLHVLAGPDMYPFVSEQTIVNSGKSHDVRFFIDASYPQFDGITADFSATNARFAGDTRQRAADVMPGADAGPPHDTIRYYAQSFKLHRPSPVVIAVETSYYGFQGGAHGYAETYGTLVDLRNGRIVGVPAVFAPGSGWLQAISEAAQRDLKSQFAKRPGFDEALEPDNMAQLLRNYDRYIFKREGLAIVFNQYEVGPYSSGPYFVDIPYARLRPLVWADGPLGANRSNGTE